MVRTVGKPAPFLHQNETFRERNAFPSDRLRSDTISPFLNALLHICIHTNKHILALCDRPSFVCLSPRPLKPINWFESNWEGWFPVIQRPHRFILISKYPSCLVTVLQVTTPHSRVRFLPWPTHFSAYHPTSDWWKCCPLPATECSPQKYMVYISCLLRTLIKERVCVKCENCYTFIKWLTFIPDLFCSYIFSFYIAYFLLLFLSSKIIVRNG